MAREVYLSSLSAGRCFTVVKDDANAADEEKDALTYGRSMMSPENAWKVVSQSGDVVTVENAAGDSDTLPANSLVVEIPRQGFDRLKNR